MKTETNWLIRTPQHWAIRCLLQEWIWSVLKFARRNRWRSWAGWTDAGLLLRLQEHNDRKIVRKLVDNIIAQFAWPGVKVSSIETSVPATPLPDITSGPIPWGTIVHQTLTSKFLGRLPDSAFIISSAIAKDAGRPMFAMPTGPITERQSVWRKAKEAGVDGQMSSTLWFEEDFKAVAAGLFIQLVLSHHDPHFMASLAREIAEHQRA